MSSNWKETILTTEEKVLEVLADLQGKHWLSRGQSDCDYSLVPSIDRDHFGLPANGKDGLSIDRHKLNSLSRFEKISLERQSIDLFKSNARCFAGPAEQNALFDDVVALMVIRHYGVPTRLLDWSKSSYVAAYFAVSCNDKKNGVIWSFDQRHYRKPAEEQWIKWPETTSDFSGDPTKFDAKLTAFSLVEPPDWFIVGYYLANGFPRQNAQNGCYTMTARFGRDHAEAIERLFADSLRHHRYVIPAQLKPGLRRILREEHAVWRGTLFPDSAGAADTAREVFKLSSGSVSGS